MVLLAVALQSGCGVVEAMEQVADVAALTASPVRRTARQAMDAVRRGVVAYSSVG